MGALFAASPAAASLTRGQAEKKALAALGVKKSSTPVIVFRLFAPLAPGARIAEAGSATASASASAAALKQSPQVRRERLMSAGVRTSKAPLVAKLGSEKAWFFYADRAPFKAFEHDGQVVIVGARTGKVLKTRVLRWPPLIDGRLPAFMRTAEAYRAKANRIFYRPWAASGARAAAAMSDAFGSLAAPSLARSGATQRAADALAAQNACAVRISDTLGDFYDFGNIDSTRARLGAIFDGLAALNPGFQTVRYSTYSKRTPSAFIAQLIKMSGCKQLLLYVAGGGIRPAGAASAATSPSTAVIGTSPHVDGTLDSQTLSSGQLEQLVRKNPGVAFSVIVDAPFSGGFVSALGDEPNVPLVMSPVAGQGAFGFLPELQKSGALLANPGNPDGLLEFTNRLLTGLDRFFSNPAEADAAANQSAAGFIAWMFARAFQGSADSDFPASVPDGSDPQVDINFSTEGKKGDGPKDDGPKGHDNTAPVATAAAVSTPEDTPVPVTLTGVDADGDPLTYAVATPPSNGVLSGPAPNLTYTPNANFNGTDALTFTVGDGHVSSAPATVSITVNAVNDAPALSALEAPPIGYVDGSAGAPLTAALAVADVDNANITGATVTIGAGHDPADDLVFVNTAAITGVYNTGTGVLALTGTATKAAYQTALRSVRFHSAGAPSGDRTISFQVSDGASPSNIVSRHVLVDVAPTDIALTPSAVDENLPSGTTVGTLSSTDPDAGDTHTYSLVAGAGSGDNGSFSITGTTLKTAASFDFEAAGTRSIRVLTDDGHGGTFEKQLTVTIGDVNDAPTDIALSNDTVAENHPSGTTVGDLSSTDQDAGATHTYSLVAGTGSTDNAQFQISGAHLQTNAAFDFEAKSSYSVRVQSDDGQGGTFEKQFTVTVTNANDTPTDIALSPATVAENLSSGATVGTLSSSDQDTADTQTYTFAVGAGDGDNGSFTINGTTLETAASFDFETKSSYAIRLQTDDGHGGTFEKALTVTVTDANDDPTDIALSNNSVDENAPQGTGVGNLSTTDQDADTQTYTLVSGTGSTDNAQFQVNGSTLEVAGPLDFEAGSTRSVRIQTDDGHGGTFEKQFTITVNDLNDAPTDIGLTNSSVDENQPSGTTVGSLSGVDQDAADTQAFTLVSGTGSADNGSFQISGSDLQTAAGFDFETKSSYSIRIQTDDGHGGTFEKQFTITVNNTNDTPTDIALSNNSVDENQPSGTLVGLLTGTDQDTLDTLSFALVAGTGDDDNASFQVSGTELQTNASFDFETKSSYSVRLGVSDGNGGIFEKQFTITVTDANDAPTDITLSNNTTVEHQAVGTTIGGLTSADQDGDTQAYALVPGTGSTDNALFQISGTDLQNAADLATGTYSIRVQTDDGHGGTFEKQLSIDVVPPNAAPTDIALSNNTADENTAQGTDVGNLTTTDPDAGDTHTYALVTGTGDDDNAQFQINGSTLEVAGPLDFEAGSTRSVRIQTDDGHGGTFEKQFTITVVNKNDAPTDIALSNSSVAENQASGTLVGLLSGTDQDTLDTLSFTLVAGTGDDDNASFQVSGTQLQTNASFDFETKSSYSVRLRVSDGNGGTFEKQFTITVTDANDAPTDIALSPSSVAENQPAVTDVGTLSSTDPDGGDTHSYALVAGTGSADNGSFTISGTTLKTSSSFDFETKSSYAIRVESNDGNGGTFEKQLTVTVTNANDAPTDISLTNATVAENQASGAAVGTLLTADQDGGDPHNYTLVTGTGDDDNAQFQIVGSALQTNATFDFETKSSYSIRVQTDDTHGGTFEKQLTITIGDANDAPTDIALSKSDIDENQPVATAVGNFSTTDQDTAQTHAYTLVAGTGSTDNGSFTTAGNVLKTAASFNFENQSSYSIRVRSTDNGSPAKFTEKQFTITINDINDAPVDGNEATTAVGNTLLEYGSLASPSSEPKRTVSGNLLSNATDEDLPKNTLTVSAFDATSTQGGTVSVSSAGAFTYRPQAGDSGADSFNYTVSDGAGGTDTSTVTVTIGTRVWYVKNDATAGGTGGSGDPFDTLGEADAAANATNDITYVYKGSGSAYGSNFSLQTGQKLLGEPVALVVSGDTLATGNTSNRPKITGTVSLASGSRVEGVDITGSGSPAITGFNTGGSDVVDVNVAGNAGGVSIGGSAAGTFNFTKFVAATTGGTAFSASGASAPTVNLGSAPGTETISATGGGGLFLSGISSSSVIALDALSASSGSSAGVNVNNGGTLTIAGAANTLTSTTGTALSVQNTTIGAADLNFRSIASNGAADGIVLAATGNTGGLTVAGSGGTCTTAANCTGGAIQNSSGAGILLTTVGGGVDLTRMFVGTSGSNTASDGIRGTTVAGFSLSNSVVMKNGDASGEHGLNFTGLTGTATFATDTVDGNGEDGLRISNSSGTLTANVTGGAFQNQNIAGQGGDGIQVDGTGGTQNLNVQGPITFAANRSDHIQVADGGSSTATQNVTVNNATMTSPASGILGGGITISPAGAATVTTHITNNSITGAQSSAINHNFVSGSGSMQATITNNTTTSPGADGIQLYATGTQTLTALVQNNNLSTYNFAGIDILQGSGTGAINATLENNAISSAGPNGFAGIYADIGTTSGDAGTSCLQIGSSANAALKNTVANSLDPAGWLADVSLRQRFGTTVRLPQYGGTSADTAAVRTYLQGRNTLGGATPAFVGVPAGSGYVNTPGGPNCPLPS